MVTPMVSFVAKEKRRGLVVARCVAYHERPLTDVAPDNESRYNIVGPYESVDKSNKVNDEEPGDHRKGGDISCFPMGRDRK